MKFKSTVLGVIGALAFAGCGNSNSAASAAVDYQPKVGDGSKVVVCAAVPQSGSLKDLVKSGLEACVRESQSRLDVPGGIGGIDLANVRWLLCSLFSFPDAVSGYEDFSDFAIAVSIPHNLDDIAKSAADSSVMSRLDVAGVPALAMEEGDGARAYLASLDGQLLLVSDSLRRLEQQVLLYRDGSGESPDLTGLKLQDDELCSVIVPAFGQMVSSMIDQDDEAQVEMMMAMMGGKNFIKDMGMFKFSFRAPDDGTLQAIGSLEMGSEEVAKMVAGFLTMGIMTGLEQARQTADSDPDSAVAIKVLESAKVDSVDGRVDAKFSLPQEHVRELVDGIKEGFASGAGLLR